MNAETAIAIEAQCKMPDGTVLFVHRLEPRQAVRANVVLVHGLGEHSARYRHVAERLAAFGFRPCLFDLRGHGRSEGKRGHIGSYEELLDDAAAVFAEFARDGTPTFLYGHSLGGQLAINFATGRKPAIAGLIIASPWLELAFAPRFWKLWLAQLAVRCWPRWTQQTEVRPERLSRDPAFLSSLPDPELIHHRLSAHMYFELVAGARRARDNAATMEAPLLLVQGEADPITSVEATRAFFKNAQSPDKTLLLYPGGLHETHNDLDRETVLRDVVEWLDRRCA